MVTLEGRSLLLSGGRAFSEPLINTGITGTPVFATIMPMRLFGLVPVFVDINPRTLNRHGAPYWVSLTIKRLKDAGEYAVPYLLDAMAQVIQDPATGPGLSDMLEALPQIGLPAIRPLASAL